MRLAPLFVVLCLILCLCDGAPPKEVTASGSSRSRCEFTKEEDEFIIEELLRFPGNIRHIFGKVLWEYILKGHQKKFEENTSGFPRERRHDSLRKRFSDVLLHNYPEATVKVPEAIFQKFPQLNEVKTQGDIRNAYTPEEDTFILKELRKRSSNGLYASSTWEAMKTKHEAKRKKRRPGFENERTADGLRSHMVVMKQKGLLSNDVSKKLRSNSTAGRGGRPTPPRESTKSQETNKTQSEDEWVKSILRDSDDDNGLPELS